jgi:hypothetical protein
VFYNPQIICYWFFYSLTFHNCIVLIVNNELESMWRDAVPACVKDTSRKTEDDFWTKNLIRNLPNKRHLDLKSIPEINYKCTYNDVWSRGSSVSIVSDYGLDEWGLISGRGKEFFF